MFQNVIKLVVVNINAILGIELWSHISKNPKCSDIYASEISEAQEVCVG